MMTLNGEPMIYGTVDKLTRAIAAANEKGYRAGSEIEREIRKRASNVLAAAATYAINDVEDTDQVVIDAVRLLLKLRAQVKGNEL